MMRLAATVLAMFALSGAVASAAERTVTLAVENMYCDACPYIVKQSLAKVPGVEKVVISFEQKTQQSPGFGRSSAPQPRQS